MVIQDELAAALARGDKALAFQLKQDLRDYRKYLRSAEGRPDRQMRLF